ncbi:MAG: 2-C-methyl-D-erythritol 4-phosphate cytidylyltransferase [Spirochaetia bacterium]|nr:2-C-methyl-D-erythritol 4-phosphate cytidylyltransferase [Spirochaetia bacterium]
MSQAMKAAAVLTAAGLSSRFNASHHTQKKELIIVEGKSVLQRTIDAFTAIPEIGIIVITYPSSYADEFRELLAVQPSDIPIILVEGGDTRQHSVRNGIEALSSFNPEIVMIHDGARPWVTTELIRATYEQALIHGGSAPGLFSRYALKSIDTDGFISTHHERDHIIEIQTPQTFRYPEIRKAHHLASHIERTYHDDTEIFSDWGGNIRIIPGDPKNIKITYLQDLE